MTTFGYVRYANLNEYNPHVQAAASDVAFKMTMAEHHPLMALKYLKRKRGDAERDFLTTFIHFHRKLVSDFLRQAKPEEKAVAERVNADAAAADEKDREYDARVIDLQKGVDLHEEAEFIGMKAEVPRGLVIKVINDVCRRRRVSPREAMGRRRKKGLTAARHEVMWTLAKMGYSITAIGRSLEFDHTTVSYAIRKHEETISND